MATDQIIKSCLLVSLRTEVRGGVSYDRRDLDTQRDGEALTRKFETVKRVESEDEHKRAIEERGAARSRILSQLVQTPLGYLCPTANRPNLEQAIRDARSIADRFNTDARYSRIIVRTLTGEIAGDDDDANRAIAGELRDLIAEMKAGIKALDPKKIRRAAMQAKNAAALLDSRAEIAIDGAVAAARRAARAIVAKVEKKGLDADAVLRDVNLDALDRARFGMLELDTGEELTTDDGEPVERIPSVDVSRIDAIELDA